MHKTFKYKKGQEVMLTDDARSNSILADTPWSEIAIRKIDELFVDDSIKEYSKIRRYRIGGLWFNEDEIFQVSKETHPEYYL